MIEQILKSLIELEGKKIKDLPGANNFSLKNKSYSRLVLDNYLSTIINQNKQKQFNVNRLIEENNFVMRTVPISFASLNPLESSRISSISLINLADENWEYSEVYKYLKGVLFIPFLIKDRHLGQPYREFGKAFIWKASIEEIQQCKLDWLLFKKATKLGSIPNRREKIKSKKFPTEADTKFIHMRPHSTKGKFELDKFGNQVRRMAFMLNKGFLRNIIVKNK